MRAGRRIAGLGLAVPSGRVFYWLDLLLAEVYGAITTGRFEKSQRGKLNWLQCVWLIAAMLLPAALIAAVVWKFCGSQCVDLPQFLWRLFESGTARWLLLVQIALRLVEALFVPIHLDPAKNAGQALMTQMVNRFCVIGIAFAPSALILTFASSSLTVAGVEYLRISIVLLLALVWTLSDAFPAAFTRFVRRILK